MGMKRALEPVGYDIVSIRISVWRDDPDADQLRCYVTERNTTLNAGEGATWTDCRTVPLQYARIGQNLLMHHFTEHVMEYVALELGEN